MPEVSHIHNSEWEAVTIVIRSQVGRFMLRRRSSHPFKEERKFSFTEIESSLAAERVTGAKPVTELQTFRSPALSHDVCYM